MRVQAASPKASSATANVVETGALTTVMPCFFAASRSMLSTPTPARPITFRLGGGFHNGSSYLGPTANDETVIRGNLFEEVFR